MITFAHGLAGRADLPIPAELFGVGAAVVLVASFLGLAVLWSSPRLEPLRERPLFRLGLWADVLLGTLGIVLFLLVVYAGLAGEQRPSDNLAPTTVYVVFWIGMAFVSILLGNVFRLLSPWRAAGRATGWVVARVLGDDTPEPLEYPRRLGQWPAAVGIVLFAAVELCWGRRDEPDVLAVLALAYFAVMVVGQSLYGVEAWTRHADPFGAWFSLLARLAPFARDADGRLVVRRPGAAAAALEPVRGTSALLVAGIGSTFFDGAREGPLFSNTVDDLQAAFRDLGLNIATALEAAFAVGLLASLGLVALIFVLGTALTERRRMAHSLIPIAAAYLVAHYFSLLVYNGQDFIRLLSDPLGEGSDLLGTAGRAVDYGVVSTTAIWYVQVGALVVGHVWALVLAHDRALVMHGGARDATRSQIAMLTVMVAFTMLGLWQLSVANQ